jgi:hypothetical protein
MDDSPEAHGIAAAGAAQALHEHVPDDRQSYTNAKVKPTWSGARPMEFPPWLWFRS